MSIKRFPVLVQTDSGEKWGYIDRKGTIRIKPQYSYARDFQKNGLAVVEVDNRSGVIDTKGDYVVEPLYESVTEFSEGRATVYKDNGFQVINEKGTILTPGPYPYIGSYQNGLALFSLEKDGTTYYGYLNNQGEEAIPAQYLSADPFTDARAVVQVKENQFALINRDGNPFYTYNYPYVGNYGEGLLAFQEDRGGKYGYINERGRVVIEPSYDYVQAFKEGRAVVTVAEDYIFRYGLIDQKGKQIIKPIYDDLNRLGEKRIAVGKAIVPEQTYLGSHYAIANLNGDLLSPFRYQNVTDYEKGLASAHDNENTFFLNRKGNIAQGKPVLPGQGTLSLEGPLIKAMIDYELLYLTQEGEVVWRPKRTIRLNNQYRILKMKFKPNVDYLVYYPVVRGLEDGAIQKAVNEKLRDLSQVKDVPKDKKLDYSYFGDFAVEYFHKDLVVIELNGSQYYFGAAHPMPTKVYANINLVEGTFYQLADLFKEGSPYTEVLTKIVNDQIQSQEDSYYFDDVDVKVAADQPFYVNGTSLFVYYAPYEIAPYVAGFPTFEIPFEQITEIIDKNGEFWRSFHN
ncbi:MULTISPECIES: WG repeat-containing protein [Pontibacillus]|uniref:WG repeat-containing protein n=1 Tax=Pontibacillus chungwhensis TaxID=265426 RepID=A0ABY8V0P2_9BACI|nr:MULTISPECIES: WG repeat-containing protein [Pontibacillus]MCD5325437.1 WG repeat-containing protein [Pontibacillus sp. HN14]WIF98551.1 WG repeat-containing protein [Pontibacillus chungwhensis]